MRANASPPTVSPIEVPATKAFKGENAFDVSTFDAIDRSSLTA